MGETTLIYILISSDDNHIVAWSYDQVTSDHIAVEIDSQHEMLFVSDYEVYAYNNGVIEKSDSIIFKRLQIDKKYEMDQACKKAILAGFSHAINGIEYWFSYDIEAQLNFTGAESLFNKGVITEIEWTVTNVATGEYERIMLDSVIMDELVMKQFQHKNDNIIKYRSEMLPKVEQATTIADLELIAW